MKEMLRVAEAENQRKKEETENKDVLGANFPMQFYYSDCLILPYNEETEGIYIHVSRLMSQPFPCKRKLFPHQQHG
jgi:hypothetical protein